MLLLLFIVGIALTGSGLSKWLWKRLEPTRAGPAERVASALTLGIALWVALSWVLSAFHALGPVALVVGACALGALGLRLLAPFPELLTRQIRLNVSSRALAGFVAIGALPCIWLALICWRGTLLPPLNHDALAYHLTKAVMIVRAGGYAVFPSADVRISSWPSNYEMLVACVVALTDSDLLTAWISGLSYVYFLALVGAVAERWWGRGAHVLGAILLAGAMPIALLHSGQHKNDLLACAMALGAIVWMGSWSAGAGPVALLLAVVCLLLGCGTKLYGIFLLAAVAPFFALGIFRRWRSGVRPSFRLLTVCSGLAVTLPLLLGNATYLISVQHAGTPFGITSKVQVASYGIWGNLWRFPYLALAAPFAKSDSQVWVPWVQEYWFWPRYDLFFSNYGAAVTLALAIVPIALWKFRRADQASMRLERVACSIMAVAGFFLVLPINTSPTGFFASFVRYTMFIVPIIAAWSVVPLLRAAFAKPRWSPAGWALLAVLSLNYGREAYLIGTRDSSAPIGYVGAVLMHPELKRLPFAHGNRAAFFVDRVAGAMDHVAIDGGYDTWSYPAYGEDLTRRVSFILPLADGSLSVPDDADWVMVDRSWSCLFGDPGFKTFGDWWTHLGRGKPTAADLRVTELLSVDPRFKLVYSVNALNQAVFKRVRPGATGTPEPVEGRSDP